MWNHIKVGPEMYKVFDFNYPETVRKVFIVRTSWRIQSGWNLVKPLLPERTKKKLNLYGWDSSHWARELRSEMKEGQELPAFLIRDDEHSLRTAEPKGGILPEGCAGDCLGQFEEADEDLTPFAAASPLTCSHKVAPRRNASGSSFSCWFLLVATSVATAVTASALGVTWPLHSS